MPGKQKQRKTKSKRNAAAKQDSSGITSYRFGPSSRRFGSLGLAIVLGHVALKANYGGSSRKNK